MVAISKSLLSLLLVAVGTATLSMEPTSATLTPFPVEYDGLAMYALVNVGEIGDVVAAQADVRISSYFNLLQTRVQTQAAGGTLTWPEFVRVLVQFKAEANNINPKFTETLGKQLTATSVVTEDFITRAPTYWADYLFSAWVSTAKNMDNSPLRVTVNTFIAQIETQIQNRVSPKLLADQLSAFYKREPTFAAAVDKEAARLMAALDADFAKAVAVSNGGITTTVPTTNTTTTTTTAAPTTSTTTTTSVPTTPAPILTTVTPTNMPTIAPPAVVKGNTTTTAPAPAAKSSATTVVVGSFSALVAVGTLAVAFAF